MSNALDIILKSKRPDLISKYLFLKNINSKSKFFEELYLAFIEKFNGFYEKPNGETDAKIGKEQFIESFKNLYNSIKNNGFDTQKSIPIIDNEPQDGAHRIAVCAALEQDISTNQLEQQEKFNIYDYKFFLDKELEKKYLDYCALEYVKLNPNAYIVNLHAVNDTKYDKQVEDILNKYGFIYYKKEVYLNYNGYVNIKKLSYGSDMWGKESWIGTSKNKYSGAQKHAQKSFGNGKNPLRAYVFVCDNLDNVLKAKAEIRELFKIGNESIHINDTRKEAIALAQVYFNDNSIDIINSRPFEIDTKKLDEFIEELKQECAENNINIENICGSGSTPMAVCGLKELKDLDYLYCGEKEFNPKNNDISEHTGIWANYYVQPKEEIIINPQYHFYYKGLKFISFEVLKQMKRKRNEVPKDIKDIETIEKFEKGLFKRKYFYFKKDWIIKKQKYGLNRTIILFGFIKFSYTKKNK